MSRGSEGSQMSQPPSMIIKHYRFDATLPPKHSHGSQWEGRFVPCCGLLPRIGTSSNCQEIKLLAMQMRGKSAEDALATMIRRTTFVDARFRQQVLGTPRQQCMCRFTRLVTQQLSRNQPGQQPHVYTGCRSIASHTSSENSRSAAKITVNIKPMKRALNYGHCSACLH